MQGINTWSKESNYLRRSNEFDSINFGQGGHVYKTIIRTFYPFILHIAMIVPFLENIKFSVDKKFVHGLKVNTF